jgi:hypothetical protein
LLQHRGQGLPPAVASRRGVEEVTTEGLEQQRPQADEPWDVVLHGMPYTRHTISIELIGDAQCRPVKVKRF